MPNNAGASGTQYYDTPVFNALVPKEGPKALAINAPFTSQNSSFSIDLTLSQTQQYISVVQGLFVDNSLNADIVEISIGGNTGQVIKFPAGGQGYIPILASKPTNFVVSTQGAVNVLFIFLNVPVPAIIWGDSTGGGGGGGVIEITNPGSTPTPASGATIAGSSDGSGNLMVMLNACTAGNPGDVIFENGKSVPLQATSYGALQVSLGESGPTKIQQQGLETASYVLTQAINSTPNAVSNTGDTAGYLIKNPGPNTVYISQTPGDVEPGGSGGYPLLAGEEWDGTGSKFCISGMYAVCASGQTQEIYIWIFQYP